MTEPPVSFVQNSRNKGNKVFWIINSIALISNIVQYVQKSPQWGTMICQIFHLCCLFWKTGIWKILIKSSKSRRYYAFLFSGAVPKSSFPLEPLLIQYEPARTAHTRRLKTPIFAGAHLPLETLFCYGFHRQLVEKIKGPNMHTDWFNKSSG